MTRKEIKEYLKGCKFEIQEEDMFREPYKSSYIGSFMSLDPCGRFHHILSPNGATVKCERFWASLESVATELGGYIEAGEGDPTDIFFSKDLTKAEIKELELAKAEEREEKRAYAK